MTTDSVETTYRDFLFGLGADTTHHSGRTLYEHLEGVQKLLRDWGNEESVCTAGLFHSVYGTDAFKEQIIPLEQRDKVRAVVGEEAESLAYLFCVCKRHACLAPLLYGALKIRNFVDGKDIPVTEKTLRRLLEMEVANFAEQHPDHKVSKTGSNADTILKTYAMATKSHLSEGAYATIKLIHDNTYSAQPAIPLSRPLAAPLTGE